VLVRSEKEGEEVNRKEKREEKERLEGREDRGGGLRKEGRG